MPLQEDLCLAAGRADLDGLHVRAQLADADLVDFAVSGGAFESVAVLALVEPLDLVNGMQAAAYVSKWGIEEEMTKGHLKQGKKGGHVSPFGLLDLFEAGDAVAGEKFKEFAECFKGKRQLVWSKGLREKLGLGEGKTDQEIAEEVAPSSEIFARIPVRTWKVITDKNKVCELLAVCGKGKDFLDAWLQRITDFEDLKRGHVRNNLSQASFKN